MDRLKIKVMEPHKISITDGLKEYSFIIRQNTFSLEELGKSKCTIACVKMVLPKFMFSFLFARITWRT